MRSAGQNWELKATAVLLALILWFALRIGARGNAAPSMGRAWAGRR